MKNTKPFILLAPMEGVVDPIIRHIYSLIGGYDQMVTEFIRVTDRLNPPKVFYKFSPELKNKGKTSTGVPVWIQLLGGKPGPLGENAALAESLGAPGLDLNFGCPARTVNRHDGGASLLKNPHRLYDIITTVKRSVRIPVSAKVRLGYEDKSLCLDIAQAVDEAQACHLVIHARTKKEGYKPPAHWEFIAQMKEKTNLPIIANGDIWSVKDYFKCAQITGCKDVALGRSAMAFPSLALEIQKACDKDHLIKNSEHLSWIEIKKKILPFFFQESQNLKNETFALNRLKQWCRFLMTNYPEAETFFKEIKGFKTAHELKDGLALVLTRTPDFHPDNSCFNEFRQKAQQ